MDSLIIASESLSRSSDRQAGDAEVILIDSFGDDFERMDSRRDTVEDNAGQIGPQVAVWIHSNVA